MSLLSPLFPRGPIDLGERLRPLEEQLEGPFSEMPGWQVIHTPGHTPGHVSFFRSEDRTLLPGDAFCTTKPESFFKAAITQTGELHGPPAYFTWDWELARQSVQNLAALNPLVIAPGHGQAIAGPNVATALRQLAMTFDELAVPDKQEDSAA